MRDLLSWPLRRYLAAAVATVTFAVIVAVPTAVIPNPLFTRMTPVQWWNYPVLATSAVLGGLVAATYVRTSSTAGSLGRPAGGGLLSALAIGCPVCNKIVVMVLGVSGALNLWAPIQPILGLASLGLLGWALRTRLSGERACRLPSPSA